MGLGSVNLSGSILNLIPEPVNGSVDALLYCLQFFRQLGRINHQTEFKSAPVKILVIHLQMDTHIKNRQPVKPDIDGYKPLAEDNSGLKIQDGQQLNPSVQIERHILLACGEEEYDTLLFLAHKLSQHTVRGHRKGFPGLLPGFGGTQFQETQINLRYTSIRQHPIPLPEGKQNLEPDLKNLNDSAYKDSPFHRVAAQPGIHIRIIKLGRKLDAA